MLSDLAVNPPCQQFFFFCELIAQLFYESQHSRRMTHLAYVCISFLPDVCQETCWFRTALYFDKFISGALLRGGLPTSWLFSSNVMKNNICQTVHSRNFYLVIVCTPCIFRFRYYLHLKPWIPMCSACRTTPDLNFMHYVYSCGRVWRSG